MKGCVMGTLCGSVFGDISMGKFENYTCTLTLEIFHSYGMELNSNNQICRQT